MLEFREEKSRTGKKVPVNKKADSLFYKSQRIAIVCRHPTDKGFYWIAGFETNRIPNKNTVYSPVSRAEAKKQVLAYCKQFLTLFKSE